MDGSNLTDSVPEPSQLSSMLVRVECFDGRFVSTRKSTGDRPNSRQTERVVGASLGWPRESATRLGELAGGTSHDTHRVA
jgi:hypothetical protein